MVLTRAAALAAVVVLGAADASPPGAKQSPAARVAAVERDLCVDACPTVPAEASSDWLRSSEGQSANGCRLACRTHQPAAALYRELVALAGTGRLGAEAPLVKLAGKDGAGLAKRLTLAVKDWDGRRLGPLCGRAREALGPRDEAAYLSCVGRSLRRTDRTVVAEPAPGQALRCATLLAERELDWLKRCVGLESRTDVDACALHAQEPPRRMAAAAARAQCEAEAIASLGSALRVKE